VSDVKGVSVNDLTADQLESLEDELDLPVTEWGSKGSVVRTMRRMLEVGNGVEKGAYKQMTAKAILAVVSLDDSDPNP
jgi:photosystem II stability/assembly factor-like uncharacterized protein